MAIQLSHPSKVAHNEIKGRWLWLGARSLPQSAWSPCSGTRRARRCSRAAHLQWHPSHPEPADRMLRAAQLFPPLSRRLGGAADFCYMLVAAWASRRLQQWAGPASDQSFRPAEQDHHAAKCHQHFGSTKEVHMPLVTDRCNELVRSTACNLA